MFSGNEKKPFKKVERIVSYGMPTSIKESLGVHKQLAKSTKIAGVDVPITHQFGKYNLDEMPRYDFQNPHIRDLFKNSSVVNKVKAMAGIKTLGSDNLKLLMPKASFYTERIIVEKYKEIGYVKGFSNDTVQLLNQKGYNRRQIGIKLGTCLLKEVSIHHAHPVLAHLPYPGVVSSVFAALLEYHHVAELTHL